MDRVMEQVEIVGKTHWDAAKVFTPEALEFLTALHDRFEGRRQQLLESRIKRQAELDAGKLPDFLASTKSIREGAWSVAPVPKDLEDRRVEITGPVERKMMINALNSGAKVFMADLEDALSPTWNNVVDGQLNLIDAVRRTLTFTTPEGKEYRLNEEIATLVVRPRGWHLNEDNAQFNGKPMSASLFDFGLYFFHNCRALIARQTGPYFYLPKMESHLEARLWNDVFVFAQDQLGVPKGTIKATCLIETILAAFEMEEILYELREHSAGLNAGRWDYIFSLIKKTRKHSLSILPDRAQVTMAVPFMRAYAQLLVKTCHKRKAHAIGGMAAFIPSRKDKEVNEIAFSKVREDKNREAGDGFDGTWVAHPDLVAVAREVFDKQLGEHPHQLHKLRDDVQVTASQILDTKIADGKITRTGLTNNIDVALQYIESWLSGVGAAAIHNLMEDAATAEISRVQLWRWIHSDAKLDDGTVIDKTLYEELKKEVLSKLEPQLNKRENRLKEAVEILDSVTLPDELAEFLTIRAYDYLSSN